MGTDGENGLIVLVIVQHSLRSDELLANFKQRTASVKSDVENDTNSALVVDRDTARCRLLHHKIKAKD